MNEVAGEVHAVNRRVITECERLRKSIQIISDKNHGPLDKSEIKSTLYPFVLLLGNHSSGKSSFVNYLMDRKIQTAGVAPTDDSFTIIAPGQRDDIDRDGSTLVGDPDLGFQGLKHFGPVLVHKTQLKIRSNTRVKDFWVVDTPGMIDSPMIKDHFGSGKQAVIDRGYSFEAVCRWYAERADVILLFFDPDKPGTTGETLSILTTSLNGMDHKLLIILNKADQFLNIHDFVRCYGSLCWNLSKVIPRKDLPQINTMCLPIGLTGIFSRTKIISDIADIDFVHTPSGPNGDDTLYTPTALSNGSASNTYVLTGESNFLRQGYADLEETRAKVTSEVFNAPKRRVDHEISRLSESVYLLLMHCKVIDSTVSRYKARVWANRLNLLATGCAIAVSGLAICTFAYYSIEKSSPSPPKLDFSAAVIGPPEPFSYYSSFFSYFTSKPKVTPIPISIQIPVTAEPGCSSTSASAPLSAVVESGEPVALKSFLPGKITFQILKIAGAALVSAVGSLSGLVWWQGRSLSFFASSLITEGGFDETFSKVYARSISDKDEFAKSLWQKVRSRLSVTVTYAELSAMRRVLDKDLAALERILDQDIANLRRQASDNFPSSSAANKKAVELDSPLKVSFSTPSPFPRGGNTSSAHNATAKPASPTLRVGVSPFPTLALSPTPHPPVKSPLTRTSNSNTDPLSSEDTQTHNTNGAGFNGAVQGSDSDSGSGNGKRRHGTIAAAAATLMPQLKTPVPDGPSKAKTVSSVPDSLTAVPDGPSKSKTVSSVPDSLTAVPDGPLKAKTVSSVPDSLTTVPDGPSKAKTVSSVPDSLTPVPESPLKAKMELQVPDPLSVSESV
jgi:GTPase SAR1 family protein